MTVVTFGRVSRHREVAALLAADFVWDAAERVDAALALDATLGGRPRRYPMVCAVIWDALVQVFGSSRQVEVELGCVESGWWKKIRVAAASRGIDVPEAPMRRHHYEWLRNRYLTVDASLDAVGEAFRDTAALDAVMIGLCDPEGGGSLTHPSPDRVVVGDGKVVTPRFKTDPRKRVRVNKTTGEVREIQADPDARLHVTGGGDRVFGTKFVLLSTRGDARNQRVVLDVTYSRSNEAADASAAFERTLPLVPGCQAVAYDGAFRGKHLRPLLKRHGVLPVSRLHSAQHGEVPDRHLGIVGVIGGTAAALDVHLVNGSPCARTFTVDGDPIVTPLRRVKTERRGNPGGWRLYNVYAVPDEMGGGRVRLRLDQTDQDIAAGFNREEHLRAVPPDDPDHAAIYGRRNDTESGNRLLDDSMLRERAHTVGWRRQLLNVTCWAAVRNAVAVWQHCPECVGLDPPIAA